MVTDRVVYIGMFTVSSRHVQISQHDLTCMLFHIPATWRQVWRRIIKKPANRNSHCLHLQSNRCEYEFWNKVNVSFIILLWWLIVFYRNLQLVWGLLHADGRGWACCESDGLCSRAGPANRSEADAGDFPERLAFRICSNPHRCSRGALQRKKAYIIYHTLYLLCCYALWLTKQH